MIHKISILLIFGVIAVSCVISNQQSIELLTKIVSEINSQKSIDSETNENQNVYGFYKYHRDHNNETKPTVLQKDRYVKQFDLNKNKLLENLYDIKTTQQLRGDISNYFDLQNKRETIKNENFNDLTKLVGSDQLCRVTATGYTCDNNLYKDRKKIIKFLLSDKFRELFHLQRDSGVNLNDDKKDGNKLVTSQSIKRTCKGIGKCVCSSERSQGLSYKTRNKLVNILKRLLMEIDDQLLKTVDGQITDNSNKAKNIHIILLHDQTGRVCKDAERCGCSGHGCNNLSYRTELQTFPEIREVVLNNAQGNLNLGDYRKYHKSLNQDFYSSNESKERNTNMMMGSKQNIEKRIKQEKARKIKKIREQKERKRKKEEREIKERAEKERIGLQKKRKENRGTFWQYMIPSILNEGFQDRNKKQNEERIKKVKEELLEKNKKENTENDWKYVVSTISNWDIKEFEEKNERIRKEKEERIKKEQQKINEMIKKENKERIKKEKEEKLKEQKIAEERREKDRKEKERMDKVIEMMKQVKEMHEKREKERREQEELNKKYIQEKETKKKDDENMNTRDEIKEIMKYEEDTKSNADGGNISNVNSLEESIKEEGNKQNMESIEENEKGKSKNDQGNNVGHNNNEANEEKNNHIAAPQSAEKKYKIVQEISNKEYLVPEDVESYYECAKIQVIDAAIAFVRNRNLKMPNIKNILANQLLRLKELKRRDQIRRKTYNQLAPEIIRIFFGHPTELVIRQQLKDNDSVLIPKWLFDNVKTWKNNYENYKNQKRIMIKNPH